MPSSVLFGWVEFICELFDCWHLEVEQNLRSPWKEMKILENMCYLTPDSFEVCWTISINARNQHFFIKMIFWKMTSNFHVGRQPQVSINQIWGYLLMLENNVLYYKLFKKIKFWKLTSNFVTAFLGQFEYTF